MTPQEIPTPWPAPAAVAAAMQRAARAIPPAWPLATSVAVNPYLGQSDEPLAKAGARLARVAGAPVAMPRRWYAAKIACGDIADDDLAAALADAADGPRPADVAALKAAAGQDAPAPRALPTIADLAARASGVDWPGVIADRLGGWAAGHFDEGQAVWPAPDRAGAYAAWRAAAAHDLTPAILGLTGFARYVRETPRTAAALVERSIERLALPAAAAETYFHQLLVTLGGWAQLARCRLWRAEQSGDADATITDLLAIRLAWEEALFLRYGDGVAAAWSEARAAHAAPLAPSADLAVDVLLQDAAERGAQRALARALAAPTAGAPASPPLLQAAFCIDVRSEIVRRALESLEPGIQTLGFAGFFGLATAHRGFASDVEERRLPVLLTPALRSRADGAASPAQVEAARVTARAKRAWGRFQRAAVSSFAFVEAAGPVYAAKLVAGGLGFTGAAPPTAPLPRLDPALDPDAAVQTAETVLRAMSLTGDFARLVLLVGHGARVVNNPHASALQCGACGGYSGEVNARLLASLLNTATVRRGLCRRGVEIPDDTLFLAGLHDTTTDTVSVFADDHPSPAHAHDVARARGWLAAAGAIARTERARRLPRAAGEATVRRRARDWSETRPEWGLAGCRAFIAAPRRLTLGKPFEGRAFLHDYDRRRDEACSVLESILTAPVVVANWISLQYYGSTVSPDLFGGGDKLLHNVTGGIGVVEGAGGSLRAGLPWQSVHDGQTYAHDPLRLTVCIAAPPAAMTQILSRHPGVRALFDHRWMHLFALDDAGRMAWRYLGDLTWAAADDMAGSAETPLRREPTSPCRPAA